MAFIAGIFSRHDTDRTSLKHAIRSDPYFDDRTGREVQNGGAWLCYSGKTIAAPFVYENGSQLLIFGTLILPSGNKLRQRSDFENEFIPQFKNNHLDFLLKCEGAFWFAFYDASVEALYIASDAFGNLALHYSIIDDTILFSSRQQTLAHAIGAAVDLSAIAEFAGFQQTFSGKTFYRGVYRFPNASVLKYESGNNADVVRYYTPSYKSLSFPDTGKRITEIQRDVATSYSHHITNSGRVGVALTGGFDSRFTLSIIHKLKLNGKVEFFTHGLSNANDIRVAKMIASKLNLRHHVFEFSDELLSSSANNFQRIVEHSEGGLGIEASPVLATWQEQADRYDMIVDSQGGQMYRRQILRGRMRSIKQSGSVSEGLFHWLRSPVLASAYLTVDAKAYITAIVRKSIDDYINSLPDHLSIGDKIDRFYVDELCTYRTSLDGNLQLNYLLFSHPAFSIKAFEHVSQLPLKARIGNQIYLKSIAECIPEATLIPLDNAGYYIPYSGFRWKRYVPRMYEKLLSMITPTYLERHPIRKPLLTPGAIVRGGEKEISVILNENADKLKEYLNIDLLLHSLNQKKLIPNNELIALTNFALLLRYLDA